MKSSRKKYSKERHKVYYGTVELERTYCKKCETSCLVIEGIKQCCDEPDNEINNGTVEYIVSPIGKRIVLSPKNKKILLDMQDYRCIYCNIRFGAKYWYKGKFRISQVNYDHFSPFIYGYDNRPCNFVASCRICNSIKHSKIFDTFEDAQSYILKVRESRGLEIYL